MSGVSEATVMRTLAAARTAQRVLDQLARHNAERSNAYNEVVAVASRMADQLGNDNVDVRMFKALLLFQQADALDRIKQWGDVMDDVANVADVAEAG